MSFKSLGVHPALIDALASEGKTTPFPIQKATLPEAIAGRDILGRGQTGSGKTLAFGLALITRLAARQAKPHRPLGLILAPTRELAVQISEVVAPLSRTVGLNSQVVAGGMPYSRQIQALKRGVPIIVATPGRLMDLLDKGHIELSDVEITVLDEADQMADMGFLPSVKEILEQTKKNGQRLLFSATLDRDVDALVKRFLKDPVTHSLANEKSTEANMEHHVLIMDQGHKDLIATQIAAREGRTIFFVKTKHGADKLAEKMLHAGVPVGVLHGGKSQAQRTRVLAAFKDGRTNALVATDVAARGIHVDGVSLVVHVDAPQDHKDYLHRAGRTARAGATGTVVSLSTVKQKKGIHSLVSRADIKLKESHVRPSADELIRLTGAQEPSGVPIELIEEVEKPRSRGGSRDRDRGRKPSRSQSGRPERAERSDRPERSERPARTERFERSERPAKSERPVRTERPAPKPDRYERSERPTRTERPARPAREPREEWIKKPAAKRAPQRPEKVDYKKRPEKFEKFERDFDSRKPAKKAAAKPFRSNKFDPMVEKSEGGFRAQSAAKKSAKKAARGKPVAGKPGAKKFAKPAGKPAAKKAAAKKVAGKKPRTKSRPTR